MGIKIPTYQDRLSPEGFQSIRATAPDMTISTADSQGLKAFGDAVSTYGATQYHLERQRSNNDNSTAALADLSAVQNQVQKDIYDGVDKMGVGATLTGEDGQPVPFGQAMQAQVKARYDAVQQKYANATPEVKQYVARQITAAQTSWNSEINSQAEKGAVVTRLAEFDKGLEQRAATAMANPQLHDELIAKNKEAVANLGISPTARYEKLTETQTRITNQAIAALQSNPSTNPQLLQSLQERLGNYGKDPNPFLTTPGAQPGQAAGFVPQGVAASTDLGAIAPAIAGAEGTGKNSASTANGKYQFIDSTFVTQARASFPELKGKSNAEILALRGTAYNGQAIEEKMGTDFIAANAQALQAANLPATGQNVYLAHFLGAAGAIKVLTADPNTPIEQITTADARAANPKVLKPGMTAQNIINWAGNTINRQGGAAVASTGGQPAAAAATRQEVPSWIQNIVNQVPAANVNQALISSTAEMHRQAQTTLAAFNTLEADHIAKASNGIAVQTPLTQGQYMAQHPLDGVDRYNNYAATLQAGELLSGMKTMPTAQAQAALEAYRPDPSKPGYAAALTRFNAVADGLRNTVASQQKDPMQYALDNKIGSAQPIDFKTPESMGEELKKRAALAGVMKDAFRTDGTSLFTANEANMLKGGFNKATEVQTLTWLAAIRSSITDPAQYAATMQTLAKDQPVIAMAGRLLGKAGQVTAASSFMPGSTDVVVSPTDVARTLLKGSKLLYPNEDQSAKDGKGKVFPMPSDKDFDTSFENYAGKVFRGDPETRHEVLQATRAYYASRMADVPDYSGAINDSKVKEAVKAVTGGISDTYNVIRPWGWSEDTFINGVKGKLKEIEGVEKMTGKGNDTLSSAYLLPLSDSKYVVATRNGVKLLGPTSGEPMVVDLYQRPGARPPAGVVPPSQDPGADQNAAMASSTIDASGKGYVPPDMKTKLRGR